MENSSQKSQKKSKIKTAIRGLFNHKMLDNTELFEQVTFRPKSVWQKDGCINKSVCKNEATLEAVPKDAAVSAVRCCSDEVCKEKAAKMAIVKFERRERIIERGDIMDAAFQKIKYAFIVPAGLIVSGMVSFVFGDIKTASLAGEASALICAALTLLPLIVPKRFVIPVAKTARPDPVNNTEQQ